jgi:hypothetical protein
MATVSKQRRTRAIEYPSGDGKPMAETEIHLHDMIDTIQVLERRKFEIYRDILRVSEYLP